MKKTEYLKKNFFNRDPDVVAKDLLGKILVVRLNGKNMKAKIVETEAYFGEKDLASWARHGKRKDNQTMWGEAGTILIKNVHKHNMLNFVTGKKGNPQAVLIRSLEPLNFEGRCSGPGLLTGCLNIGKEFNGKSIFQSKDLWINNGQKVKEIVSKSFRVGVVKDLEVPLRFYLKENKFVSKRNE